MNPINESHRLYGTDPAGEYQYFALMHALNTAQGTQYRPDEVCLTDLYNEILVHALQTEHLVTTDSHSLQNHWLQLILENPQKYPQFDELFRKGVLLVAKRKVRSASADQAQPILATFEDALKDPPFVIVNRTEKPLSADQRPLAIQLEALTRSWETDHSPLVYDTAALDLKRRMVDVLNDAKLFGDNGYGLDADLASHLLEKLLKGDFDDPAKGYFKAILMYQYSNELQRTFPQHPEYVHKCKTLATSVHSCNFPLTYQIFPIVSTEARDKQGARALFSSDMPDFKPPETDSQPTKSASASATLAPLTPQAVLTVRDSQAFHNFCAAKRMVMEKIAERNGNNFENNVNDLKNALAEYAACLNQHHLISGSSQAALKQVFTPSSDNKSLFTLNLVFAGFASLLLSHAEDSEEARNEQRVQMTRQALNQLDQVITLRRKEVQR